MVSIHDEELLQLYLDRELGFEASRGLERRIATEPELAARLESLVSAREARARVFEVIPPAAGSLDQLLLSLRAARASELIAASRGPVLHHEEVAESTGTAAASESFWNRPRRVRFWGAVAACLLVGLLVGIAIDRQPAGGPTNPANFASFGSIGTDAASSVTVGTAVGNGLAQPVNSGLMTPTVAVRVVRADGQSFVFRFPDEDSADAWTRAMYDRLANDNLESKFDFEVIPTWY